MKNNRYSISIRYALMLLVFLLGLPSFGFGVPQVPQSFWQDGIMFQVVDAKDKTLEVFACDKTLAQDVVIPSSVNYEGIHYKVITIGTGVFYKCDKLTSIELPNSVTTIGIGTFEGCIYNHRTTKTNQKYPSVNL